MGKLKRPSMLMFLKVPGETPKFHLCGVYSDNLSISYNPVTEESQDVTEVAGTTDVTGYTLNISVATKVVDKPGAKGYDLSHYIQTLRRKLATSGEAETEVLIVDTYESAGAEGSYVAQKFAGTIQLDSYGGAAAESLGMEYTVNINGEPINGSAKVTKAENNDMTAEFTAEEPTV